MSLFLEEDGKLLLEGLEDPNLLKAVFIVGSGGSGKSSVAKAMFAGTGMKMIDADRHLERFLKDAKIPLKDVGLHYDLFTKARDLRGKELRHYAQRRMGLLIDSTGWDYPRVAEPAKKLRKLGYDVYMVYVKVGLDTALDRNKARGAAGGREVPDSFITTAHQGAEKNLASFITLLGNENVFVVDNDKDVPATTWDSLVAPALRRIGDKIAAKPLKNPLGKAWIEYERKARSLESPLSEPEWKADPPKPKAKQDLAFDWSYASEKPAKNAAEPFAYKSAAVTYGKAPSSHSGAQGAHPKPGKAPSLAQPPLPAQTKLEPVKTKVLNFGKASVSFGSSAKVKTKLAAPKLKESLLDLFADTTGEQPS
jgi:predicted ABC-type ATPase